MLNMSGIRKVSLFVVWLLHHSTAHAQYFNQDVGHNSVSLELKGLDAVLGCEGEGCGCTYENTSNKLFVLYKEPSKRSAVIGRYDSGTTAIVGVPISIVRDPGRYRVVNIKKLNLRIPKNAEFNRVFYLGEGEYYAIYNGQKIRYEDDALELKTLSPTKYETWFPITVGEKHGYASIFPFEGCLE